MAGTTLLQQLRYLMYIGSWLMISTQEIFAEDIFHCSNTQGKKIYTDNLRHCAPPPNQATDKPIPRVELTPQNIHSQYGQTISEEYYNYAYRKYSPLQGYRINIIAEDRLAKETPELLEKAAKKLEHAMLAAIAQYPLHIQSEFNGIKYYLFTGDEARTGGRKGGCLASTILAGRRQL